MLRPDILHEPTCYIVRQPEAVVEYRIMQALLQDPLVPADKRHGLEIERDQLFEVMKPEERRLLASLVNPPVVIGSGRFLGRHLNGNVFRPAV